MMRDLSSQKIIVVLQLNFLHFFMHTIRRSQLRTNPLNQSYNSQILVEHLNKQGKHKLHSMMHRRNDEYIRTRFCMNSISANNVSC